MQRILTTPFSRRRTVDAQCGLTAGLNCEAAHGAVWKSSDIGIYNRLTTDELARAMGMLECGSSQRRVANGFGVSQRGLTRAWNRFQTYGSATQRHAGGRQ